MILKMKNWIAGMMIVAAPFLSAADSGEMATKQSHFIALKNFSQFAPQKSGKADEQIFLSSVIKAPIAWNELVVSWNLAAGSNGWCKIEARGIFYDHKTKFFTLGLWSENPASHRRESVADQKDSDG